MSLFSQNQQASDDSQNPPGSLESLDIPVQTSIPEGIITPATAKAIQFRPKGRVGYSFKEVDQFVVNIVRPAIDWYVNALYQRDTHVHRLGEVLDKAETDIRNLRAQAQFLDYNSQIAKGLELGQDDAEVKALLDKLATTEEALAATQAELLAARSEDAVQELLGVERQSEPTQVKPNCDLPLVYKEQAEGVETISDAQLLAKLEEQEALVAELRGKLANLEGLYATATKDLEEARQEIFLAVVEAEEVAKQADGNNGIPTEPVVDSETGEVGLDPETQAHIDSLHLQYAELRGMYEELSTRYTKEVTDLQEQISLDKAELARLQDAAQQSQSDTASGGVGQAENSTGEPTAETTEVDEATQTYINELLSRYNALVEQYTHDTGMLQTQVDELLASKQALEVKYAEALANTGEQTVANAGSGEETSTGISAEAAAEIEQLREYYDLAVNQYNTLLDMYNQMVEQVEAGGASITVVQASTEQVSADVPVAPEVDLSQYVSITDYQQVVSENEALRKQLEEDLGAGPEEEDDSEYTPQFMLPVEDLKRNVDPSKYSNLPPGVLPEDLE